MKTLIQAKCRCCNQNPAEKGSLKCAECNAIIQGDAVSFGRQFARVQPQVNKVKIKPFTGDQLTKLKGAFADIAGIDPSGASYQSMIEMLNTMPQANLRQVADANIKFLSVLAKNRLI